MTQQRDDFLKELDREAKWHYSRYQLLRNLQVALMIAIAVAGFLTANAGVSGQPAPFYSGPVTLVVLGLVSVVCAAVNQWLNPERRSAEHYKIKMALRSVEGAVKYRDLPIAEAELLRTLVFADPERALVRLSGAPE